jgi:DNA-binding transcriptional ArsR family regulator
MAIPLPIVLDALADSTRLEIVSRLRHGPRSVGAIASELPVSRPAVSIHLRVLAEAGLVTRRREGRRNFYSLRPQGLAELRSWLDGLWGDALTAFAAYVEATEVGE